MGNNIRHNWYESLWQQTSASSHVAFITNMPCLKRVDKTPYEITNQLWCINYVEKNPLKSRKNKANEQDSNITNSKLVMWGHKNSPGPLTHFTFFENVHKAPVSSLLLFTNLAETHSDASLWPINANKTVIVKTYNFCIMILKARSSCEGVGVRHNKS